MARPSPLPHALRALAVDHPEPLGDLAGIFYERNIAMAMSPDGHVLLVRPDSALVAAPKTEGESGALATLVEHYDQALARALRTGEFDKEATFLRVSVGADNARQDDAQPRWSIAPVNEFLTAAPGLVDERGEPTPVRVEYNHVVIGAQTVRGSPLGVVASWAGEMAFVGRVTTTEAGRPVMLTTAEPSAPPIVLRDRLDIPGHERPQVLVLDTGLRTVVTKSPAARRAEHESLTSCRVHDGWIVDRDPGDVDDEDEEFDPPTTGAPTTSPDRLLDFEAGHGTFISGIVRQICPDADLYSAGVLSSFGDGDVDGVVRTLRRVLTELRAKDVEIDVVVMSFGTNLLNDESGFFGEELRRLLDRHGALGVAAAGNQATCRPYFPAALPDVIGVGGLATDGKAWFTNFGGWVDACAPAVDVISTFFTDFTEIIGEKPTRQYDGWARWSGTSFSAPKVAAVIAQEMYLNQVSAKQAWKQVTSHKHLRYPDLGIVFNV